MQTVSSQMALQCWRNVCRKTFVWKKQNRHTIQWTHVIDVLSTGALSKHTTKLINPKIIEFRRYAIEAYLFPQKNYVGLVFVAHVVVHWLISIFCRHTLRHKQTENGKVNIIMSHEREWRRNPQHAWIGPVSVFITTVCSLVTPASSLTVGAAPTVTK